MRLPPAGPAQRGGGGGEGEGGEGGGEREEGEGEDEEFLGIMFFSVIHYVNETGYTIFVSVQSRDFLPNFIAGVSLGQGNRPTPLSLSLLFSLK